ncbi:MAG: NAD(P)-binding protein [Pseudomonadota bacterium]
MRDPRYDILFEPIRLGPVTSKNRFYQVPHCSGMGWKRPETLAAMRGMKAEGGWGVVCTEYCSIHPTSDDGAYPYARLWDGADVRAHALMADAVHEHGSLAGVELWIGGSFTANLDTRVPSWGVISRPPTFAGLTHPVQSRRIDKDDIKTIRQWHKDAAERAIEAGFDIVYVYATHGYLLSEFLDRHMNDRTDEYGGMIEDRVRIVRELIEDTGNAVKGKAAVACRFSVSLDDPETYEAFGELADLPDVWDLTVDDYSVEMGASRFVKEGALESPVAKAKALTSKPVVAVGRFTTPDTMARMIRSGVQDMIDAARPSIADPFLPKKIEEGRPEDIRECIGCNICYAHNSLGVPIRCTQNPTMGEEFRHGWHPEDVPAVIATPTELALIVGSGPAGLEAARALGARGMQVMIAEASRDLGGRVTRESRLPGLSEWARVRDWRLGQIDKLATVEPYPESDMSAQDCLDIDPTHILVATGSRWTVDGLGRNRVTPFTRGADAQVISVDDVIDGLHPEAGHVTIFDDDHYYMGSVVALELARRGLSVTLVTTAGRPFAWGAYTEETHANAIALREASVSVVTNRLLEHVASSSARFSCMIAGEDLTIDCDAVVPLTRREPQDALYHDLAALVAKGRGTAPGLARVGDCDAPGTIAAAVYSGYRTAIELGGEAGGSLRERAVERQEAAERGRSRG